MEYYHRKNNYVSSLLLVENDLRISNLKQYTIIISVFASQRSGNTSWRAPKQGLVDLQSQCQREGIPGDWQNPVACICVASLSVALKSHSLPFAMSIRIGMVRRACHRRQQSRFNMLWYCWHQQSLMGFFFNSLGFSKGKSTELSFQTCGYT